MSMPAMPGHSGGKPKPGPVSAPVPIPVAAAAFADRAPVITPGRQKALINLPIDEAKGQVQAMVAALKIPCGAKFSGCYATQIGPLQLCFFTIGQAPPCRSRSTPAVSIRLRSRHRSPSSPAPAARRFLKARAGWTWTRPRSAAASAKRCRPPTTRSLANTKPHR